MIRKFRSRDEPACRKIISECFYKSVRLNKKANKYVKDLYAAEGFLTRKSKKYDIFVYEQKGKVVGMGALQKNYIGKVYVRPSMHGKGIGSEMLIFLENLAVKRGYKAAILHAYRNSQRFYSNKGYKFIKMFIYNEPGNTRIPTYEMRKKLR